MRKSRWSFVLAGVGVLLLAGVVYAWSVLSVSIAQEFPDWSRAKLSLTFTLLMAFFCIGQISCGFVGARMKPRTGIWLGGTLLLAGFVVSARMSSIAMPKKPAPMENSAPTTKQQAVPQLMNRPMSRNTTTIKMASILYSE